MDRALVEKLRCLACGGEQIRSEASGLACRDCGYCYEVKEGIPILLPPTLSDADKKDIQAQYYEEETDPEFELDRPHGAGRVYTYLMDYKIGMAIRALGDLPGKTMLNVCCGSGIDSEYFADSGANVVGLDISLDNAKRAVCRAGKYGFKFQAVGGDAERLPFKSHSFDYTFVHDGLHHLPVPHTPKLDVPTAQRRQTNRRGPPRSIARIHTADRPRGFSAERPTASFVYNASYNPKSRGSSPAQMARATESSGNSRSSDPATNNSVSRFVFRYRAMGNTPP